MSQGSFEDISLAHFLADGASSDQDSEEESSEEESPLIKKKPQKPVRVCVYMHKKSGEYFHTKIRRIFSYKNPENIFTENIRRIFSSLFDICKKTNLWV